MVGFIGAAILALFLLVSGSSATRRRSAGMLALTAVFLLPVDLDAGTATRIQLVAHIPVPPPLPQLLSTTATASSQESGQSNCCSPAAAIDGNASTRWSSQFSDNQWLTLDLGKVQARLYMKYKALPIIAIGQLSQSRLAGPWAPAPIRLL